MINLHPSDCTLVKFSEGTLSSSESLLVSAHCDMCPKCADKVETFTESLASKAFDTDESVDTADQNLFQMCEFITSSSGELSSGANNFIDEKPRSQEIKELPFVSNPVQGKQKYLYLDGRKFELPKTLERYNVRLGEWSKLVGKIWQCQIDIGGGCLAQFVYMEKGGSVPEHTHKGNELTLVIAGEFFDGLNHYDTGDYISLNNKHRHIPRTQNNEGCLVFSIIDEPLHFTSGWAKLVNPLSHLYFHVNSR